jgi:hypothetical protein
VRKGLLVRIGGRREDALRQRGEEALALLLGRLLSCRRRRGLVAEQQQVLLLLGDGAVGVLHLRAGLLGGLALGHVTEQFFRLLLLLLLEGGL